MTQLHDALLVTCVRVTELICSSVQFLCCEHGISCTLAYTRFAVCKWRLR